MRRVRVESKNRPYFMSYESYRNRSLKSLSKKEWNFVLKSLLYEAKPEEG